MPKSSESTTTIYSAKGRANHEPFFFRKGRNLIKNAQHRIVATKQCSQGLATKQCRPKCFKIMKMRPGALQAASPQKRRARKDDINMIYVRKVRLWDPQKNALDF